MNVNIFYDSVNVFSVLFMVLVVPMHTLDGTPCDLPDARELQKKRGYNEIERGKQSRMILLKTATTITFTLTEKYTNYF